MIIACFKRQLPSTTSTRLYTILFSRPSTTSRFLKPVSVSIITTFLPSLARPVPILAVVVVLPTPPFPDVTTITSLILFPPNINILSK